jgi:hypothetical protein
MRFGIAPWGPATEGFIGTNGGAMLERIAPYDLYPGRTVP